jgi:glycosyltransferase involved in cell wall biosynthesis
VLKVINVIEEGKLGGPQVRMARVAAALAGQVETLVVMPRANSGPFRKVCEERHVSFEVLPLTRMTKEWRVAFSYFLFSPFEVLRLARLIRRAKADLVHVSGGSWQIKGVIAARLAGVPCVWHLNDTLMPRWVRGLFRIMQPWADGFIYTGQRVMEYYGAYISGNRPTAIVQPPVDVSEYDPEVSIPGDDEAITQFGNSFVIGTIGNINPVKGLETLIRAGALLRERGYDVQVVIVGPISSRQQGYADQLRELAVAVGLDKISFPGGRSDVRPLLKRMDAYVCPSVSESWGMSLWEAMAMAKPIVSTDVGDVARHVMDGESGFVVPVGDAEAMAERIGRLLDAPELRARMGRAARAVAATFSPELIAGKTLDIYERVLASASRGNRHS